MLIVNSGKKNIEILGTFKVFPHDWLNFQIYASFEGVGNAPFPFVQRRSSLKIRYVKLKNLDNFRKKYEKG